MTTRSAHFPDALVRFPPRVFQVPDEQRLKGPGVRITSTPSPSATYKASMTSPYTSSCS